MSVRGTVWLQLGDAFDGPRIGPPLHMQWAAKDSGIFPELESIIEDVYKNIAPQPPDAWERLASTAQPPSINGRRVMLNITSSVATDLDGIILMKARLPFRLWPLGGWVVIEGWNRKQGGVWTPLAREELEKIW